MPLLVNVRHLEAGNVRLTGQLPAQELDIDTRDEMIRVTHPLDYDLEAQMLEGGLLIRGRLHLLLDCECVRCLKPIQHHVELSDWNCHLPMEGEDAVAVANDCVDLVPAVREDILLDFPRHPLCNPACRGLPKAAPGKAQKPGGGAQSEASSPAWAELNKLKF
jgi:uncharacterized protein